MTREEHQRHMDALAMRISRILDDENLIDAAIACSACTAFALAEMPAENRPQALALVQRFFVDTLRTALKDKSRH